MLGGPVDFGYCRSMNDRLPCKRVVSCWERTVDIEKFLLRNYSAEERESMVSPSKGKVESLLDLIEQAKRKQAHD